MFEHMIHFLISFWQILGEMAPWLLLGFLMSGLIAAGTRINLISQILGKTGFRSILKATLIGIPLPLCSCGVIPVTTTLYRKGASKGATVAFLTSTPQTGIDSIAATWGILGPVFSTIRVGIALISGLISGILVEKLDRASNEASKNTNEGCCSNDGTVPQIHGLRAALTYAFDTLPRSLSKSLLGGLLIATLIGVLIPQNTLPSLFSDSLAGYAAITLLAIPLYVCSTGSIPFALALIQSGFSPGAALIFLVAGPATNAATLTTMLSVIGKRSVFIYLMNLIALSWLAAWLLDTYLPQSQQLMELCHHLQTLTWWEHASAFLLMVILLKPYVRLSKKPKASCPHCCGK
jgi:uncharacterized membrane protein YraQ (UPF0718 family)